MGQKVNPHSFRLGSLYTWSSNWYAKKGDYSRFLVEDTKLRGWLFERLKLAGITEVKIDRSINTVKITLSVARPGVVIGRGGSGLEELKKAISVRLKTPKLELQVVEVKNPDLSARLIGLRLADQLLRRYPHRRAIAQILEKTMASGAKGVKIKLSGRINGAEISNLAFLGDAHKRRAGPAPVFASGTKGGDKSTLKKFANDFFRAAIGREAVRSVPLEE